MALHTILTIVLCAFTMRALGEISHQNKRISNHFDTYYSYLWGSNHISINSWGTEAKLKIDQSSGAGFRSKSQYRSGLFRMKIKLPKQKTDGIITAFYLTSVEDLNNPNPGNHFELDFEFIGTKGILQTNVFNNDGGNREQKIKLWFDPAEDFHTYEILWNPTQIVFFVDETPIRVFKNNMRQGINFPTKAMHVETSLWSGQWAGVVDWSKAPFFTQFSDFGILGCSAKDKFVKQCASNKYFWNRENYRQLNAMQKKQLRYVRNKYMVYDYCWKQSSRKKECSLNNV